MHNAQTRKTVISILILIMLGYLLLSDDIIPEHPKEFCYKGFVYADRGVGRYKTTITVYNQYGMPQRCPKEKARD